MFTSINHFALAEVERLDNSPFRYFLGELYGDNALRTMFPFGLPSPACDANVPSSGPPYMTHCGLLPRTTGNRAAAASPFLLLFPSRSRFTGTNQEAILLQLKRIMCGHRFGAIIVLVRSSATPYDRSHLPRCPTGERKKERHDRKRNYHPCDPRLL